MKKWFIYLVATALSLGLYGCGEKVSNEPDVSQLQATISNLMGVWALDQWHSENVADGLVIYLSLEANNKFTLYQNVDSSVTHALRGTFSTYTNASGNTILRGVYNNSYDSEWSYRYVVKSLTATTLTVDAVEAINTSKVVDELVFQRCELPDELKGL